MRIQNQPPETATIRPGTSLPLETEPPPPRTALGEFARRTVIALLLAMLFFSLFYLGWRGLHVLLQAFAGVLFAVFLVALADGLHQRTRLSYGWSLALVLVTLFLITGGIAWLLANQLAIQVRQLSERLPESLEQIRMYLNEAAWGPLLLDHQPNALAQLGQAFDIRGFLTGVTGFLVGGLVILFVGIFGAAEPGLYKAGALHLVPPAHRRRANEALTALDFNLRWWLVGQAVLMVIVWLTTTAGLWLIGIPFALALGLIAGIFELVPYIGPWLSAVPAALIALTVGPTALVMTLGLYLLLHILEGYLLAPLIQRGAVHLPPALMLVAQILLGEVLGPIGLFVAAPATLCVIVLLKMLYVEDTLGDQSVDVPGEPGNEVRQANGEVGATPESAR
jgi:predicted PurR-regulated permease PerM